MRRIVKPLSASAVTAAASLLAFGCGESSKYANHPREPSPVTIAASIVEGRINLSPAKVGAGPIVLSVTNLSPKTVSVKFEPQDAGSGRATSGPVNPDGTAQLSVKVEQGSYRVSVKGAPIAPASLKVNSERQSAQNDLLLP